MNSLPWHVEMPVPLFLAIVMGLLYLLRVSRQHATTVATKQVWKSRRELRRALSIVNKLEEVIVASRKNLAQHRSNLVKFKDRVGRLYNKKRRKAARTEFCREVEELLNPTIRLVGQVADSSAQICHQSTLLMAFTEARIDPLTGVNNRAGLDHALRAQLAEQGIASLLLHSAAHDRNHYLQRPDLGRRLVEASVQQLRDVAQAGGVDVAIVVADGLSALAVHRHAAPLIARLTDDIRAEGWSMAPIVLVEQGRVAVADEVGERLGARMSVILIGERPGLSSPDSLGLYFTYAPKIGLTDAARNCISNVRPEGLSTPMAAHKLLYLMREAWRRQLSGVQLKEEAEVPVLGGAHRNFLLD